MCDQVPEEAIFPRDAADKHHVITAPYILLDGIPLSVHDCNLSAHMFPLYSTHMLVVCLYIQKFKSLFVKPFLRYTLHAQAYGTTGVRMSMEYNTMMITGQKIFRNDSLTFGQAYDQDMQPIFEVQLCIQYPCFSLFASLPVSDSAAGVKTTLQC